MNYNILVTGGAGYLGSILVPDLLAAGHRVTILDSFIYKQTSLLDVCHHSNFSVVRGDTRVTHDILPLVNQADIIIPLAALVGAPICNQDPIGATTINHDSILMMLKHLSKEQIVLMPTTNSAYGKGDKENFCTEESPLNPISKYAIDKVEVEKALMQHPNAISFRLATVFGISLRMRIDLLVNDFVYRAVNDRFIVLYQAHFMRNYIHVRDVSAAFMHCMNHFDSMKGEIYNVGLSNANLSKHQLCEKIKEQLPELYFIEAEVGEDPDKRDYLVSNEKIEKTGFKPKWSIEQGIAELIKGYQVIKRKQFANI